MTGQPKKQQPSWLTRWHAMHDELTVPDQPVGAAQEPETIEAEEGGSQAENTASGKLAESVNDGVIDASAPLNEKDARGKTALELLLEKMNAGQEKTANPDEPATMPRIIYEVPLVRYLYYSKKHASERFTSKNAALRNASVGSIPDGKGGREEIVFTNNSPSPPETSTDKTPDNVLVWSGPLSDFEYLRRASARDVSGMNQKFNEAATQGNSNRNHGLSVRRVRSGPKP